MTILLGGAKGPSKTASYLDVHFAVQSFYKKRAVGVEGDIALRSSKCGGGAGMSRESRTNSSGEGRFPAAGRRRPAFQVAPEVTEFAFMAGT